MTEEEAVETLNELSMCGDPEATHGDADDVLLDLLTSLGYKGVVKAWTDCSQKVGFWYA